MVFELNEKREWGKLNQGKLEMENIGCFKVKRPKMIYYSFEKKLIDLKHFDRLSVSTGYFTNIIKGCHLF